MQNLNLCEDTSLLGTLTHSRCVCRRFTTHSRVIVEEAAFAAIFNLSRIWILRHTPCDFSCQGRRYWKFSLQLLTFKLFCTYHVAAWRNCFFLFWQKDVFPKWQLRRHVSNFLTACWMPRLCEDSSVPAIEITSRLVRGVLPVPHHYRRLIQSGLIFKSVFTLHKNLLSNSPTRTRSCNTHN